MIEIERKQKAEENILKRQYYVNFKSSTGETDDRYDIEQILKLYGYHSLSKIASTLQGGVFKAKMVKTNKSFQSNLNGIDVVIKITNLKLYNKSMAFIEGKEYPVKENIIDEILILKWLTRHNASRSLTRYIDSFHDEYNIFLVMEDGGINFFDFITECHKLIQLQILSINEWQRVSRILFKQMIEFVDWLHTKMAICHLDISLENLLITNVNHTMNGKEGKEQICFSNDLQIKFCDFGLASTFDGKDFRCNKYVGKTGYESPEVYGKKDIFDARAADIWSLGICLFMMVVGGSPFKCPTEKERGFTMIMDGRLSDLVNGWKRLHYLTHPMMDLLNKIFQKENKRIKMKDICNHPWLK